MALPFPEPKENPCPVCGKARQEAFRPFCSPRCRQVDLGRWFSGAYAIPAEETLAPPGQEESNDQ